MLSRKDFNLINSMLIRHEDKTRCSPSWLKLHKEYELGRLIDNKHIDWSRDDLKQWQSLVDAARPAQEAAQAGADRTTVARYTANEKLTTVSVQDKRLFCHVINAPLYLRSGEQAVYPDIEYRVDYQSIDLNRYAACLIIENQESFIYCQRFNWPALPATLVLYRGHDKSVHALKALLESSKASMSIYLFPDTDPAGLSIAMSTQGNVQRATHIIAPDFHQLDSKELDKGIYRDRFATQLKRYPNLRSQATDFSPSFQLLVANTLETGMAVSQEWLCAHSIPLELIEL